MVFKDNIEYSSFIKGGVEYDAFFLNGIEYGGGEPLPPLHPNIQAAVTLATANSWGLPSTDVLVALSDYYGELETAGLTATMDLLYVMLGDGSSEFKTINLIDADTFKGTPMGTLFNEDLGLRSAGAGYVNLNLRMGTDTTQLSASSGTRGALITQRPSTTSAGVSIIEGTDEPSTANVINQLYLNNLAGTRINSPNNLSSSPTFLNDTNVLGMYAATRTSAANVNIRYVNNLHTTTQSGGGATAEQQSLLLRNVGGNRWGNGIRLGLYWISSAMDATQYNDLRDITATLISDLNLSTPV